MKRLVLAPPRFPAAPGAEVRLVGDDHHYLTRVLRHRLGDTLELGDGQGRSAAARITAIDGESLTLLVQTLTPAPPTTAPRLTLLMALLKADRLDLVVQKAVELGAAHVIPVHCARCVARPDAERGAARLERWQRIARGAAQQCGRLDQMTLAPPTPLTTALSETAAEPALRLLPYEGALWRPLRDLLPAPPPPSVHVLIGPEGGFTDAEVEAARAAGYLPCGLGPRILRAETAALAALAVLSALLE